MTTVNETAPNAAPGLADSDYAAAWAARSQEEFANAFAEDVVFEVPMVMTRPVRGREAVAYLLGSVSKVYETQRFTHQATNGPRTYMDWELTVFGGEIMRGVTAFTRGDDGKITHLAVYHRPMLSGLRLSYYAGQVMGEKFGHDLFYSHEAAQAEIDKGGPTDLPEQARAT
ncbi:nuclear transport factor 2 family protein [Nocardia sp. NBC_01499]|uniref:nuclear transport factor 2 family protein n=1 Tax=Nocardia sp. NBC_01499 TaxID=2903597 RepID=UPI00386BB77A